MNFKKYQHVCRLGTQETEGILDGKVYIMPKIDGTNSSIYLGNDGEIHCGSRNRELNADKDNQGFYSSFHNDERFKQFFDKYPNYRLYGEYLKPHSLRTYESTAWDKFYVFDVTVVDNNEQVDCPTYLTPNEYVPLLEEFGIDYIPVLATIESPTLEQLKEVLDNNTWLIQEGKGCGEGIVIKRYDYINRYGRRVWAKIIHDEFDNHSGTKGKYGISKDDTIPVEVKIVEKFCTPALIEKEYQKIMTGEIATKAIVPTLLNTVYHTIICENMWDIIKLYKNPIIDFKVLQKRIIDKIKEVKIDLFVKRGKNKQ